MLAGMSGRTFNEWMAYYAVEPFGDEWLRTAILASLIANANRDTDMKPDPFTPDDFMPRMAEAEEIEEPDNSWQANKALFEILMDKRNHG